MRPGTKFLGWLGSYQHPQASLKRFWKFAIFISRKWSLLLAHCVKLPFFMQRPLAIVFSDVYFEGKIGYFTNHHALRFFSKPTLTPKRERRKKPEG